MKKKSNLALYFILAIILLVIIGQILIANVFKNKNEHESYFRKREIKEEIYVKDTND